MAEAAEAVNVLSSFLADEKIQGVQGVNRFLHSLHSLPRATDDETQSTDAIVFCASSVLALADVVFSAFAEASKSNVEGSSEKVDLQGRNTVLVLCGGIGHSTSFLYDAVAAHPIYNEIADEVKGKAEARVLQLIAERWYGIRVLDVGSDGATMKPNDENRLLVVVEDKSTNCGANASESRKVLEACGVASPRSVIVVQDPTMSKRTVATFEKVYSDLQATRPRMVSWPTFTPRVMANLDLETVVAEHGHDALAQVKYHHHQEGGVDPDGLWQMRRFVDLLMGEIPRLRDDSNGYGPNGKGFLAHVDIPERVEAAWKLLDTLLGKQGRDR